MKLSEEQKLVVINAGKIELPATSLAILLDVPVSFIEFEIHNPNSEIFRLYEKSKIESQNQILLALTEKAKKGDKVAIKVRNELIRQIEFIKKRDELFQNR